MARKTRTYSDTIFNLGDMVYYFRNNSSYWHGPAKIIGRDGQQFLLKQGGIYVRVHPCRLQIAYEDPNFKTTDVSIEQSPGNDLSRSSVQVSDSSESEASEDDKDPPDQFTGSNHSNAEETDHSISKHIVISNRFTKKRILY